MNQGGAGAISRSRNRGAKPGHAAAYDANVKIVEFVI